MSKKIILFLSDLKENAQERSYDCPDGTQVTGTQTNEAPVKYLLHTHPGIDEVLCIVTEKAQPAFEVLERTVRDQAPRARVTRIPFDEGMDFSSGPLARIMEAVKKGDEILLETTGGLRDAVMQLLLVSRALSFSGIPTVGAVYANFGAGRIVDCSHLIGLFDMVGGMQELAGFGSVKTLRDYYGGTAEPEVKTLLDAMEGLQEDITLCRTGKLDGRIKAFNAAIEAAGGCADPLFRALLPAFRAKFGKKLNIPGVIRWCINSDMLQQALTIYKERIPAYILRTRESDLVKVISRERLPERGVEIMDAVLSAKKEYETEEEVMFRLLLNLGRMLKYQYYDGASDSWTVDPAVLTLENLQKLTEQSYHFVIQCPIDQLRDIIMDYQYIRMLRNMINHANEQGTQDRQQLTEYLSGFGYKRLDEVGAGDIRDALERGLKNLNSRPKKERKK